jgi:hypothetical protein
VSFLNMKTPSAKFDPASRALSKITRKKLFPEAYPSADELARKAKEEAEIAAGPDPAPELPVETDPDILEAQRQARRKAMKQRGVASTILGGQLDDGYGERTVLG